MSGTKADLTNSPTQVDTSMDSVVVVANLETVVGGRTLDTAGFAPEYIKAGHVVIEKTADKSVLPLNVSGSTYVALPAGHTYKGIVGATILTARPFASIIVRGTINKVASPYPVPAGAETALPLIRFTQD
jgi:hypothetical protein